MSEKSEGGIWIASFDIGESNFAWYIGEVDVNQLRRIKNIPFSDRYNANGTTTPAMENILTEVYLNGRTIHHQNHSIKSEEKKGGKGGKKGKYIDPRVFYNLTDLLDRYSDYWDQCDHIIIEEQMAYRGKINRKALKIGQHCFSYFTLKYPIHTKTITEFPAYHKTRVLGAQKIEVKTKRGLVRYANIDKPARKKWAIQKALEIFEMRGEEEVIDRMKASGPIGKRGKRLKAKLDDYCDTFVMYLAYVYLKFVNKSV